MSGWEVAHLLALISLPLHIRTIIPSQRHHPHDLIWPLQGPVFKYCPIWSSASTYELVGHRHSFGNTGMLLTGGGNVPYIPQGTHLYLALSR